MAAVRKRLVAETAPAILRPVVWKGADSVRSAMVSETGGDPTGHAFSVAQPWRPWF
jgi:hypothetical protein